MDTKPISLTFDNELSDHLAADKLYYSSTVWPKVDRLVAFLLLLTGIFGVIFAGIYWWTIILFPLAIGEWFNLLDIRGIRVRLFFKRNPKFKETYHLTLSGTGIHFKTRSIDSNVGWSFYNSILESETVFLLVYGKGAYSVIPKRAFSGDDGIEEFRKLATKKVSAVKHT